MPAWRILGSSTMLNLDETRITVAIAAYNQAHFLEDALRSVFAQTRPADQIIVVDDGSTDQPEKVTAKFPGCVLIRQENRGLSAARNTGLRAADGDVILFLDADDLLREDALKSALACRIAHPEAAFVYGGHYRVDVSGKIMGEAKFTPTGADPFADLLRGNCIGMHATVLYDRAILLEYGGFDETLRKCEDYDVYLRLSRSHTIGHHNDIVADYRIHGTNMSANSRKMLQGVETVLRKHRPAIEGDKRYLAAWRDGHRIWRRYYAEERLAAAHKSSFGEKLKAVMESSSMAPRDIIGKIGRSALRKAARVVPASGKRAVKRLLGRPVAPPLGKVRMGDLARQWPICPDFGFDRGTPVDRFYIENFLAGNRADIRGRVLEIGDAAYSRRFDAGITQQDVLHVDPQAPEATIIGDISEPGTLPRDTFDCMIITQTLHLIYDMRAAVKEMHDALKPGGTLLLTVPGISPVDRGDWGATWFWSLTANAASRLFAEQFAPEQLTVLSNGNVFAATCFLQGMALEEIDTAKLDVVDPSYPVVVTVRAVRSS